MEAVSVKVNSVSKTSQDDYVNWQNVVADLEDGRDVIIEQTGTPIAVVIPYADYCAIQEALEEYRDIRDSDLILARIKSGEEEVVLWDDVKADLFPEGLPDD